MTRSRMPLLAAALLTGTLAACAPATVTMNGAEVLTPTSPARAVTARVIAPAGAEPQIELRLADGVGYAGRLVSADAPSGIGGPDSLVVPTAGGLLVGKVHSRDGAELDCRFAILNPARRMSGGGTGYCRGDDGRQVDFVF